MPVPVIVVRTGCQGRPRKVPNPAYVREAMSAKRNISITKLAEHLDMHPDTLAGYMKLYKIDRRFSDLSDADLDLLVRRFKKLRPQSGLRYLTAFLRTHGVRVQKMRIVQSVARVDRVGKEMRSRISIRRRKYKTSRPNACWHLDGHHKLILWGIVIHGFVDGYSQTVCISSLPVFCQRPDQSWKTCITGDRASGKYK